MNIWERYRRSNGTIDLKEVFNFLYPEASLKEQTIAYRFFELIQQLQPIKSRQAAAVAISTAESLAIIGARK